MRNLLNIFIDDRETNVLMGVQIRPNSIWVNICLIYFMDLANTCHKSTR